MVDNAISCQHMLKRDSHHFQSCSHFKVCPHRWHLTSVDTSAACHFPCLELPIDMVHVTPEDPSDQLPRTPLAASPFHRPPVPQSTGLRSKNARAVITQRQFGKVVSTASPSTKKDAACFGEQICNDRHGSPSMHDVPGNGPFLHLTSYQYGTSPGSCASTHHQISLSHEPPVHNVMITLRPSSCLWIYPDINIRTRGDWPFWPAVDPPCHATPRGGHPNRGYCSGLIS